MSGDLQNTVSLAQSQVSAQASVRTPHAGKTMDATKKAAKDFEAVFISQFLGSMFEGIKPDGMFGGGQGEQIFRSMMLEQYGKQVAAQGGFGLADSVTRSLIQHQEAQQRATQAAIDAANGKKDAEQKPADGIAVVKPVQEFAARSKPAEGAMAVAPKTAPVFAARAPGVTLQ